MNHKMQSFLLAVPLLALGATVGLGWLRRHSKEPPGPAPLWAA